MPHLGIKVHERAPLSADELERARTSAIDPAALRQLTGYSIEKSSSYLNFLMKSTYNLIFFYKIRLQCMSK